MFDLDDFKNSIRRIVIVRETLFKRNCRTFAKLFKSQESMLYRLNSAQFVIVMPNASELTAYTLAERLQLQFMMLHIF
jgi:GGDEF domain-containing protein